MMQKNTWRWILGMIYVLAVAIIWIAASFVVQSVIDSGVSPFLITYVCNSLFIVYIPIVEIGRLSQSLLGRLWSKHVDTQVLTNQSEVKGSEKENLLKDAATKEKGSEAVVEVSHIQVSDGDRLTDMLASDEVNQDSFELKQSVGVVGSSGTGYGKLSVQEGGGELEVEELPRTWTRKEIACTSLLICPFWFLAQYTFNLSLKYTSVTSNTILSSTSSFFTFLMSLRFLEEKFTWLKLWSILLCMAGTIIVSLADAEESTSVATSPVWGDILCLVSALFYAAYTTLIRKKLPDESKGEGRASTALFFGFLGLFNGLLLLPIALILHFTGVEPFHRLTPVQFGLIVGKGLLDNVLSDYLWAKAVLLTTTTAATAGLSIQVPIAAVVDSITGVKLHVLEIIGGVAVLVGFFGINQPATGCCSSQEEDGGQNDGVLDGNTAKEASPATQ